jgi:hypothetical protein
MSQWKTGLNLAMEDGVPARAFLVALIVGTALNLINQGDALLHGAALNWAKIVLTYLVPYAVSTHGAVMARMRTISRVGKTDAEV